MKTNDIIQRTYKCINDLIFDDYQFHKDHEYQVDIYPLFYGTIIYKIYNNGGWNDYIFFEGEDKFKKYFELIE